MRCELLNYIEALLRSPKQKSAPVVLILTCYIVCGISCYFGIASMNLVAFALAGAAALVYLVGVLAGIGYFNNKPNLVSLMPVSPAKSLLYRFLSVLILYVVLVLFLAAFITVIGLITGGIVLIINSINSSGSYGGVSEEIEVIETVSPMGVHGGIFAAAYFVFMYGMGMVTGFIKDRKKMIIVIVCQSVAVLGGMVAMRNPFIQESYVKMAVPWLCTALCCIAALAALGTAVYMGIKQYKKSY